MTGGVEIALFGAFANDLGESPVWDQDCGWLWWVDIRRNKVMAADLAGAPMREWTYSAAVGSIGLAQDGLVAAFADHFALIDEQGTEHLLARPDIGTGAIRFNDGKVDRQGRFLSGTMQHGVQVEPLACLWRLDADGTASMIESGLKLANSICFSPCGHWLYFSDTLEGVIRRYAYDSATGGLGHRETLFDCTIIDGTPDGATVDDQGRLWVALVTSQQIVCISPEGTLLRSIDLPVPFPSCPAFGGPDMTTLFVTTIADSGHKLKSDHPDAGRMLAISGLGARGIRETRYAPDNHTWN